MDNNYEDKVTQLKDALKDKRDQKHMTNQDVADLADLPVNTVNNYFSSRSKAPSIYTVGPICAALCVSIDRHFGIVPDPDQKGREDLAESRRIIEARDEQIAQLLERLRIYKKILNIETTVIFILLASCIFIAFCKPLQLA